MTDQETLRHQLILCEVALSHCCDALGVEDDGDLVSRCGKAADKAAALRRLNQDDVAWMERGRQCERLQHRQMLRADHERANRLEAERQHWQAITRAAERLEDSDGPSAAWGALDDALETAREAGLTWEKKT